MEKYNFKDNSDLKNNTAENLFDDSDIQACSATDCTGLIPALPQDEAEVEAYEDLYPYITKAKNVVKNNQTQFFSPASDRMRPSILQKKPVPLPTPAACTDRFLHSGIPR